MTRRELLRGLLPATATAVVAPLIIEKEKETIQYIPHNPDFEDRYWEAQRMIDEAYERLGIKK